MAELTRNKLINAWRNAEGNLKKYKALESELRGEVIRTCYGDDTTQKEGVDNYDLGDGYSLKAGFKQTRKLNNENNEVEDALTELEKTPEGAFISPRLVTFKPTLSVSEYGKLTPEMKEIIDNAITVKPATPSLKFVEPKVK